ncbi:MAG: putative membrane protein [Pontimonas sp.]|jgi:putative membrane protein
MAKPFVVVMTVGRGVLIGLAEIVPGVSGGTVALIVGVYRALIAGAAGVVRAGVALVARRSGAVKTELAAVSWWVVIPVVAGMFLGIVMGAALLEPIIGAYPLQTRATFAGLILASLWVPARMVGRWDGRAYLLAGLSALVMFFLSGIPALSSSTPELWMVAPAAAIAVCALVLPGVSGSFLLVTLGMYEPTLRAVNQQDLVYLSVFILGAIIGLALFVRVLQFLLDKAPGATLAVMTGLMAGSLRALWPWQGEGRELLVVGESAVSTFVAGGVGVTIVALLLLGERLWQPRVNPPNLRL